MNNIDEIFKVSQLISKETLDDLKDHEREFLQSWKQSGDNHKVYQEIRNEFAFYSRNKKIQQLDTTKAWKTFVRRMDDQKLGYSTRKRKMVWTISSIAAVLLIGLFTYISVNLWQGKEGLDHVSIAPGRFQAELIVDDGKVFKLEEGQVNRIEQDGVEINNNDGRLVYSKKDDQTLIKPSVNKLFTPKGGEYQLVLPDGTEVWLNSDSKLEYPSLFASDLRIVKLSGEAYFKVAKNKQKPFVVQTENHNVRVLGTEFNISAYKEDQNQYTTLVEGSVAIDYQLIDGQTKRELIKPNQQLVFHKTTGNVDIKEVDTYLYTSWKDGRFVFRNENMESFMSKIARWYNVDIQFENEEVKKHRFSGDLPKYEDMSDILRILELEMSLKIEVKDSNRNIGIS